MKCLYSRYESPRKGSLINARDMLPGERIIFEGQLWARTKDSLYSQYPPGEYWYNETHYLKEMLEDETLGRWQGVVQ